MCLNYIRLLTWWTAVLNYLFFVPVKCCKFTCHGSVTLIETMFVCSFNYTHVCLKSPGLGQLEILLFVITRGNRYLVTRSHGTLCLFTVRLRPVADNCPTRISRRARMAI